MFVLNQLTVGLDNSIASNVIKVSSCVEVEGRSAVFVITTQRAESCVEILFSSHEGRSMTKTPTIEYL